MHLSCNISDLTKNLAGGKTTNTLQHMMIHLNILEPSWLRTGRWMGVIEAEDKPTCRSLDLAGSFG